MDQPLATVVTRTTEQLREFSGRFAQVGEEGTGAAPWTTTSTDDFGGSDSSSRLRRQNDQGPRRRHGWAWRLADVSLRMSFGSRLSRSTCPVEGKRSGHFDGFRRRERRRSGVARRDPLGPHNRSRETVHGSKSFAIACHWPRSVPGWRGLLPGFNGPVPASAGPAFVSSTARRRWIGWTIWQTTASDTRLTTNALNGENIAIDHAPLDIDASLPRRFPSEQCPVYNAEYTNSRLARPHRSLATGETGLRQTLPTATVPIRRPRRFRTLRSGIEPRTLRLRPGVTIEAGRRRSFVCQRGRRVPFSLACRGLGSRPARQRRRAQIRWTDAVEAAAEVQQTPAGLTIQRILVRSPFVGMSLEKQDASYTGQLEFDLDRLASQMGQLVDLSSWRLAGIGSGTFRVAPLAARKVQRSRAA